MEYEIYKPDDELTHWGIRGMRWGVRRYQRKDGSLTPAGERKLKKERAALRKEEQVLKNRKSTQAKFDRVEAKRKSLEAQKKALDGETDKKSKKGKTEEAKKSMKEMSDDELVKAVNRGRLEDAYRQLYPEPPVKKSLMKRLTDDVVVPAAMNSGKRLLENALNKAGENLLKGKVDPDSLEALTAVRDKLKVQAEIDEYKMGGKFNWDNMLKKQQYENQAEDRKSKMKGYKDAPDEANSKREAKKAADEAARKAAADEAARKANEAKSKEYRDAIYNKKTGEKTNVRQSDKDSDVRELADSIRQGWAEDNARKNSSVQKLLGDGTSSTALITTSNVSSGRSTIAGLLEGRAGRRNSNEIGYYDEYGRFHAY